MVKRWLVLVVLAGCHLALGLEEATLVEETAGGCQSAAECDDDNPCTDDACDDGACVNAPVADGDLPQQTAGDCKREVCASGAPATLADGADVPSDGIECTDDACDGMMAIHPALPGGTPCTAGGVVCSGTGSCVECFDNSQCVAPETCGGLGVAFSCGCTPTVSCGNRTCGAIPDAVCNNVVDCDNDMQDGDETDVDCGGDPSTCSVRCNEGKSCAADIDCGVNLVCPAGTCVPS